MMNKKYLFLSTASLALLAACGDDSTSSSEGNGSRSTEIITIENKSISGLSQKGPFVNGSSVTLQELDGATLAQTGKSFKGKISSDNGEFSVSSVNLVSQYALLEANGFYRNEVTGNKSAAPITLNALTDLSEREKVNINLLTHLEYERAQYLVGIGMSVPDAKKQAETEILNAFGISGDFANSEDLSIFATGDGNAALLAMSILMQGNLSEAELSERLANFATDIQQDGEWNDAATIAKMADWANRNDLNYIRRNIEGWDLGIVPNFEKFVNNFWYVKYGLGACTADRKGEVQAVTNELSEKYGTKIRYICKENGWEWASNLEMDTYQWADGEDGEIKLGDVTGTEYYDYDKKLGAWRTATTAEHVLGGCIESRENDVSKNTGKVYGYWYICKNREWESTEKKVPDTQIWSAGDDGELKYGDSTQTAYKYDEAELEWSYASELDTALGLGCTLNREGELRKNKQGNLYSCYNKIWSEQSWSWDLPREIWMNNSVTYGTLNDSRDNTTYKTIKIGTQTWMAENLDYKTENSYCYNDVDANCEVTGRLYTWAAALEACPTGWHLPTSDEWSVLSNYVREDQGLSSNTVGTYLKTAAGWYNNGNGKDVYGFSALPAGNCSYYDGSFLGAGDNANFWSATEYEYDSDNAYNCFLLNDDENLYHDWTLKSVGHSVRCLKDSN